MNIVFRTDASLRMGAGHLMRCLTLAGELHGKGAAVSFICRDLPGNLCTLVEKKGYRVFLLPFTVSLHNKQSDQWLGVSWETDAEQTKAVLKKEQDFGWLIVDNYALDSRWESQMRCYARKIMVIDDLADRPHDCNLLLDQNFYYNMEMRYNGLIPDHCQKLLGPKYALLRPEFREVRKNLRDRDGIVQRILIFFGGSDASNETAKALEAMRLIERPDIAVDVVVGGANPHKEQVRKNCSVFPNSTYYCQVENMAQLMANADLSIGAGGTAMWERCFLGLPSITIIIAQNQSETTAAVAEAGAVWNLGWYNNVSAEGLVNAVKKFLNNPGDLKEMGKRAMRLMGSGSSLEDRFTAVHEAIFTG